MPLLLPVHLRGRAGPRNPKAFLHLNSHCHCPVLGVGIGVLVSLEELRHSQFLSTYFQVLS